MNSTVDMARRQQERFLKGQRDRLVESGRQAADKAARQSGEAALARSIRRQVEATTSSVPRALRVVDGPDRGKQFPLVCGESVIGRNPTASWCLAGDSSISRMHAKFTASPQGDVSVSDCGSTYGTQVNGAPVNAQTALRNGDLVKLGRTTLKVTGDESETAVGSPRTGPHGRVQRSAVSYQTPLMNDVERGVRRFLRFYLKVLALFLLVVGIGVGTAVAITSRPRHASVPAVVGLNTVAAFQELHQSGLNDIEQDQASSSVPFGQVIATNPPAGTSVSAGSNVTVSVSCGSYSAGICG